MIKETKEFYKKTELHKKDLKNYKEDPSDITNIKVFKKSYPRLPSIDLPKIDKKESEFETLMDMRESYRTFSEKTPLSLEEISKILTSCRVVDSKRKVEKRTYPSGGARFPIELYLLSYNVKNLKEGAYHYNIEKSNLELLLDESLKKERRNIISPYLENPAATIVFTSVISRSEVKYGLRSYPYSLIEAGHMGQNIQLSSAEIGIGSCPVSGFIDNTVKNILDLTDDEIPIYSISIGKVKK